MFPELLTLLDAQHDAIKALGEHTHDPDARAAVARLDQAHAMLRRVLPAPNGQAQSD